MNRDEYAEFTRPHRRFLRQIVVDLEFFVEDIHLGSNVFSVEPRVKTHSSAIEKSTKLGIPVDQLEDLAGIRVVVASHHDAPLIARFFERRAEISGGFKIHARRPIERRDGYRSFHLLAEFDGHHSRSLQSWPFAGFRRDAVAA